MHFTTLPAVVVPVITTFFSVAEPLFCGNVTVTDVPWMEQVSIPTLSPLTKPYVPVISVTLYMESVLVVM